ncbi:MAG: helix-turn-helix transcriptional regulator [Acidimicrobiia bacterium]
MNQPREAYIVGFQHQIQDLVARYGQQNVADAAGVSPRTVTDWLNGRYIGRIPNLIRLTQNLGWDPNPLLSSAGKPKNRKVRFYTGDTPDKSLTMMLEEHRQEYGSINEAATRLGINPETFSRYINGRRLPHSPRGIGMLAHKLNLNIDEALRVCGYTRQDRIYKNTIAVWSGYKGILRESIEQAGYDSWNVAEQRQAASKARVSPNRFPKLLAGTIQPTMVETQKFYWTFGTDLVAGLRECGAEPKLAVKLASELSVRKGERHTTNRDVNVGELLRSYRVVAGLTQKQVGETVGLAPNSVANIENGSRLGPGVQLAKLAETVGAPIHRVLVAANQVA